MRKYPALSIRPVFPKTRKKAVLLYPFVSARYLKSYWQYRQCQGSKALSIVDSEKDNLKP